MIQSGGMYTGNPDVPDDVFDDILSQVSEFVRTRVVPRENEIMASDAVPADLRAQAAPAASRRAPVNAVRIVNLPLRLSR